MSDLTVSKIETDDDPHHEKYRRTASVWFENGGRIRFVETTENPSRIIEQSFGPNDPDSIIDDFVISEEGDDDYDFDEIFVTSLEVWFKDDFPLEDTLLAQAAGEGWGSPTNLNYFE